VCLAIWNVNPPVGIVGVVRDEKALTPAGTRVLDVASELFYRDGINTVGVALIADTAGVTKKTLYDCFGSKANLIVSYLRRRHDRWWSHLEQRLAQAPEPGPLVLFDAYLDHPDLDVSRGCAFLNAAAELPADHPGMTVVREHKDAVLARLAVLVAATVPDADPTVTEELFLVLEGATAHLRLGGRDRTIAARAVTVERLAAEAS